jgi:GT2 family glycosyltransferase
MPAPDSPCRHYIEGPKGGAVPGRHLVIKGWCYHRLGRRVEAVRARVGRTLHPGLYKLRREDVFQVFGEPGAESSGFQISVVLPPRGARCQLEALLDDGSWQVFEQLDLTPTNADNHLKERWRWLRFWLLAWRGKRSAWELLSTEEQEFLVTWADAKGWLSIGRYQTHAPRPLKRESFPGTRLRHGDMPKFTLVTPSLNQARFLGATAESVLGQQGVRVDYVIQDGGSSDGSRDLILALEAKQANARPTGCETRLLHWESMPDHGQADAVVRGFRHMQCGPDDLMAYLNSDDVLMPGALRFVAAYFARHPEVDFVYGHRILIDEQGDEVGRWITPRIPCDELRLHDTVPQECLFWRRRIYDAVGGLDPSFHFCLDWDLLLRFREAGARMARLPWFLGMFRLHPRQKTQAWLQQVGIPEMDRLRLRHFGSNPPEELLARQMRRAQFDSALVGVLLRAGLRV